MADRPPTVLFAVEQLRRRVPGGIGAHARGLLAGFATLRTEGEAVGLTLTASRAPRAGDDELAALGWPLRLSRLPGRALTRAWDHRLVHAPPGFDVVHSVSMAAPLPSRGAGGIPLVLTVHDLAWRRHPEATTAPGARWHESALTRARESGAHLVVPSRLVATDVMASGVDEDLITVVQSGADHLPAPDPAGADTLLAHLGVRGEYLLTVGTVEPRKNLERLVRAYDAIRTSLPEPWPLVVVGPSGWGRPPVTSREAEGVVFAGAVTAAVLAELYARARAFAYVPLTEGAGLPPLEAMRSGTPAVVAHEVPSVHDLGAPGPAPALLVDPLDVENIAAGLTSVLTDDTARADLSARGADYTRDRTWRHAARAHLELWRSLS